MDDLLRRAHAGEPLNALAKEFGMTRERVRQLVRCPECFGTGNAADKNYGMSCEPCSGTGRTAPRSGRDVPPS